MEKQDVKVEVIIPLNEHNDNCNQTKENSPFVANNLKVTFPYKLLKLIIRQTMEIFLVMKELIAYQMMIEILMIYSILIERKIEAQFKLIQP